MNQMKVLISGASIAGPTLAYWLVRGGAQVTVVERVEAPREEGQNIDVCGAACEVLRRMGLEEEVRAANTGEVGTRFIDERGRAVASFPAAQSQKGGATAELEILRGQLSQILVSSARDDIEYVYGDEIADLDEAGDHVDVTFASGVQRRFDMVVIAEGLRSRTRRAVFGDGFVRDLGAYCAYLTVPREHNDDSWCHFTTAGGGRNVSLRPDNVGTTRGILLFLSDTPGIDALDATGRAAVLRRVYEGAGPTAERLLRALDDHPFYFEALGQAHMPRWSLGRIAVTGDAAWCASPLSGMSTSLAITGAYVLAGELTARMGQRNGHLDALAAYERLMRPLVVAAQKLLPGGARLGAPRTVVEIRALSALVRLLALKPVRRTGIGERFAPPADRIELPTYRHMEAR